MNNPENPVYEDAAKGAYDLLLNREAEFQRIGRYTGLTPPSRNPWYHGRAFGWDPPKCAIVFSRDGNPESLAAAQSEIQTTYEGQLESGRVPNQRHLYGARTAEAKITGAKEMNFYGQPPLGAIAALELFHAMEKQSPADAKIFAASIFGKLTKEAIFFPVNRSNGPDDHRIGVVAGEESGMDENSIFDHQLPIRRRPRDGMNTSPLTNAENMVIHFTGRMLLDRRRNGLQDNEEGLRKAREIFWVMPVQMQALVTANLYATAALARKLGKNNEAAIYAKFANDIENQVLNDMDDTENPGMWDSSARNGRGMFRDLDRHGRPINAVNSKGITFEETSISGRMALLFPNLKEHQLSAEVDLIMEDFMDDYGVSTVGKRSPNYDPDHGEKESGRWRGPSWLDQPWLLAEGLLVHINRDDISEGVKVKCRRLLSELCDTSLRVLNKWEEEETPIPEYYSHRTGQAFRLYRVVWFAWNNLGYVMPPNQKPSVFADALLNRIGSGRDEQDLLAA